MTPKFSKKRTFVLTDKETGEVLYEKEITHNYLFYAELELMEDIQVHNGLWMKAGRKLETWDNSIEEFEKSEEYITCDDGGAEFYIPKSSAKVIRRYYSAVGFGSIDICKFFPSEIEID